MNQDNERLDMFGQEKQELTEQRVAAYMAKVMGWMCVGLLTTLATAMLCYAFPIVGYYVFSAGGIIPIVIAQLAVVLILSFTIRKMSPAVATVMFMVYAALTGVTFSSLFLAFEIWSLIYVFGITGVVFLTMAVYGITTKRDITHWGRLALFALFGIIVAGVANWFMGSTMLDLGISCIGVVIFIALTAYDTQKIKEFYIGAVQSGHDEESPEVQKLAIYGALTLYLDFINLFLKLLRILGKRRN